MHLNSTNEEVGPGSYQPEKSPYAGKGKEKPKWSIPRGPKMGIHQSATSLHQTY
jgi:hypothetical protein